MDLFAQPVYHFTFRDSYVVSTCLGSICTCAFIAILVIVMFSRTIAFLNNNDSNFTLTETLEYDYYSRDDQFDRHQIAIGLVYKPEF